MALASESHVIAWPARDARRPGARRRVRGAPVVRYGLGVRRRGAGRLSSVTVRPPSSPRVTRIALELGHRIDLDPGQPERGPLDERGVADREASAAVGDLIEQGAHARGHALGAAAARVLPAEAGDHPVVGELLAGAPQEPGGGLGRPLCRRDEHGGVHDARAPGLRPASSAAARPSSDSRSAVGSRRAWRRSSSSVTGFPPGRFAYHAATHEHPNPFRRVPVRPASRSRRPPAPGTRPRPTTAELPHAGRVGPVTTSANVTFVPGRVRVHLQRHHGPVLDGRLGRDPHREERFGRRARRPGDVRARDRRQAVRGHRDVAGSRPRRRRARRSR